MHKQSTKELNFATLRDPVIPSTQFSETPLEHHIFGAQGMEKSHSPKIVNFNAGGSKRIQVTRNWHARDEDSSQTRYGYARKKCK